MTPPAPQPSADHRVTHFAVVNSLRGVAALGVALYHVRVPLWVGWRSIYSGAEPSTAADRFFGRLAAPCPFLSSFVLLFFVISGFCIHWPQAGRTGPLRAGSYLKRRFLRIYPPYLIAVLLSAAICPFAIQGFSHPTWPIGRTLASALLVQNYVHPGTLAGAASAGQLADNPSLWSIPVEMELYLVYPLLLLFHRRLGPNWTLALTGVVSLAACAASRLGVSWIVQNFATYWVVWQSGAWLADRAAAGALRRPPHLVSGAALAALALGMRTTLRDSPETYGHLLYGFFYFWVCWLLISHSSYWSALHSRVATAFEWLGEGSYSLYLIHFPVFNLMGSIWLLALGSKPHSFLIALAACLAILPISRLFWRVIELPSHRLARRSATAA